MTEKSNEIYLEGLTFETISFQCLDGLDLPQSPFLFGVLITRWEMPWARVFPLRLLLRLGAESRYYPTPLWSWRDRTTVYKEIGQTIMQVLCVSCKIQIYLAKSLKFRYFTGFPEFHVFGADHQRNGDPYGRQIDYSFGTEK